VIDFTRHRAYLLVQPHTVQHEILSEIKQDDKSAADYSREVQKLADLFIDGPSGLRKGVQPPQKIE
jgi:hypothetical protein